MNWVGEILLGGKEAELGPSYGEPEVSHCGLLVTGHSDVHVGNKTVVSKLPRKCYPTTPLQTPACTIPFSESPSWVCLNFHTSHCLGSSALVHQQLAILELKC